MCMSFDRPRTQSHGSHQSMSTKETHGSMIIVTTISGSDQQPKFISEFQVYQNNEEKNYFLLSFMSSDSFTLDQLNKESYS